MLGLTLCSPSGFMVDTNAIGRGVMAVTRSLYRSFTPMSSGTMSRHLAASGANLAAAGWREWGHQYVEMSGTQLGEADMAAGAGRLPRVHAISKAVVFGGRGRGGGAAGCMHGVELSSRPQHAQSPPPIRTCCSSFLGAALASAIIIGDSQDHSSPHQP